MNLIQRFKFYIENDMITLSDVASCGSTEEAVKRQDEQLLATHMRKPSQGADGIWKVWVYVEGRPRKKVSCKTEEGLRQKVLDYICGCMTEEKTSLINRWEEFCQYKAALVKGTTIDVYVKTYKKYYAADPFLRTPIDDIKVPQLQQWLAEHVKAGEMNKHSYSKFVAPFAEFCRWAKLMGYTKANPFDYIDTKKLGLKAEFKKASELKAFNQLEAEAIVTAAISDFNKKEDPVPLAIVLTFLTGMRAGEIVALKWQDIEGGVLHVRRLERRIQTAAADFTTLEKHFYEVEEHTKGTDGFRDVPLTQDAEKVLKMAADFYSGDEYVFARKSGKIHYRALDLRIRKYCQECGIPVRSIHKVRATVISKLRDAGMSFERIAELAGHKQVQTTMNNYSFDVQTAARNRGFMEKGLNFKAF